MRVLLRQALRTFRGDESGQSLIVIVSAMTVLLVIAAFAIDTANWMVRHHDAQVVADSAALAAAQCLANPNQPASIDVNGQQETLTPCGSSDTQNAQQNARKVAEAYAAANGVSISDSNVTFNGKVVTVTASTNTPTVFARVTGIGSASQTAQAGAGWQSGANQCTTPGAATCDFMFAHDENCAGGVTAGINIQVNGNSSVSGNIQSNGNLTVQSNGTPAWGNGSYGPSSNGNCSSIDQYNGHDPWSSPPTQDSENYPYPIDYSTDFPACVAGTSDPCQTSSGLAPGFPSFCTNGSTNITLDGSTAADTAKTNQIYCAYGTGVKSKPSTWNGTIAITLNDNQTTTLDDSFVGGSISFNGNGKDNVSSCGYSISGFASSSCDSSVPKPTTPNYPIFYATGTSSTALDIQVSGSQTFNGDMFVPNGGASVQMNGNKSLTTFIEANDISGQVNGTLQGDGPAAGSLGNPTGGSISLVQ